MGWAFKNHVAAFLIVVFSICLALFSYCAYIDWTDHYDFYRQCQTITLGSELPYDPHQEEKWNSELIDVHKRYLSKKFSGAYGADDLTGKRFSYPIDGRTHGCMNAKFIASTNESLHHGIFQNKNYDVSLRFAEQSGGRASWIPKILTVDMKFYGVTGTRLDSKRYNLFGSTQDFLFQAAYGLAGHPKDFTEIYRTQVEDENVNAVWKWYLKHPFLWYNLELAKWRGTYHTSFNEDLYNTVTASKWGDTAAKLWLKPCTDEPLQETDYNQDVHFDILRSLARQDVCFTLFLQLQRDACHHPVDLVSKGWSVDTSPLVQLGQVIIPQGTVLYDTDTCRNLQFNPCNGIVEHQPLGIVARSRCVTQGNVSEWTVQQNLQQQKVTPNQDRPTAMCLKSGTA